MEKNHIQQRDQTFTRRRSAEDSDAELFDRLTPAEMLDLYHNDHDQWERIMKAKEDQGMQRLLAW